MHNAHRPIYGGRAGEKCEERKKEIYTQTLTMFIVTVLIYYINSLRARLGEPF